MEKKWFRNIKKYYAMIDWSGMHGGFADTLRLFLRKLPYRGYLPIIQGEASGMLWKRSAGEDGFWLGSYEAYKQKVLSKVLYPGSVFYDIGSYAGFFTLLASKKGAKVYAFEPDEENQKKLQEHIRKNKCKAEVFGIAISDKDGVERFQTHESPTSHFISEEGDREVKCRSIDSLAQEIDPPSVIKIDAEGSEMKILSGAKETIRKYKPIILVEGHQEKFGNFLPGYSFRKIHEGEYICTPIK